jgi:hypothetical protein
MEVWKFSLLRFIKFKTWLCLLTIAAKLCSVITPVCSLKIEGNAGFEALSAAIDKAIKPLTALRMPKKFYKFKLLLDENMPHRQRFPSKEMCMSACMVWALILAVTTIVATGFAYRYKQLTKRMRIRARIYMRYVPTDQLTEQERVIFEDLKKDIGVK